MATLELSTYDPTWPERFEAERERLSGALGHITEGGIIFSPVEHVGSTAISSLAAIPCIDIAIDTETPLPQESVKSLTASGYEQVDEFSESAQVFLRSSPDPVKLYCMDSSSSALWARQMVIRDYLRQHAEVRRQYGALKRTLAAQSRPRVYAEGKAAFLDELAEVALEWHITTMGFGPLESLQEELADLNVPWMVSSGWALDLFLGEPTRYHHDLDITLWYEDQLELQSHLFAKGWTLHRASKDDYSPWKEGRCIEPPLHQVHARRGRQFLDVLLSPKKEGRWLYRRDEAIALPEQAVKRFRTIPYLTPEAVLLYKSVVRDGSLRPKDERDFERVALRLAPEAKRWLSRTLTKINKEHPWLDRLN